MAKKIMTFIILCILICVLIFVGSKIANKGIDMYSQADSQDASTSLLLAQAKQKLISEKAIIDNKKDGYVGEKLKDCTIPEIEEFKALGVIAEDDKTYDSYYVWSQQTLNELSVNVKLAENEYYIVNYETNEVITTKGIKIGDNLYYKLTDIKQVVVKDN